jgi:hypothetical protein
MISRLLRAASSMRRATPPAPSIPEPAKRYGNNTVANRTLPMKLPTLVSATIMMSLNSGTSVRSFHSCRSGASSSDMISLSVAISPTLTSR